MMNSTATASAGDGGGGDGDNVGLAFGLTAGAGLATTVGALLPFCVDVNRPLVLAAALAGSAGVMIYVSMVEIMQKSLTAYARVPSVGEQHAALATLFTFVAGVVGMALLDVLVHRLDPTQTHDVIATGGYASHHINVIDHVLCREFRDAGATSAQDEELHAAFDRRMQATIEATRLKRMGGQNRHGKSGSSSTSDSKEWNKQSKKYGVDTNAQLTHNHCAHTSAND